MRSTCIPLTKLRWKFPNFQHIPRTIIVNTESPFLYLTVLEVSISYQYLKCLIGTDEYLHFVENILRRRIFPCTKASSVERQCVPYTTGVARTLKKLRTSKGDYCIKQWFSTIMSLFKMGTFPEGANSFLKQFLIVWKITFTTLVDLLE